MSHGFILPCRAAELRGILRHSHLQNRFLTWLPDSPDLVQRTYASGTQARTELDAALDELGTLLADPSSGFCPVVLMDRLGPLRNLPESARKDLGKVMVASYTKHFAPARRAKAFGKTREAFVTALKSLLATAEPSSATCEKLKIAARGLYKEISKLPKGLWLWPEGNRNE
jgi:hypothetical protein